MFAAAMLVLVAVGGASHAGGRWAAGAATSLVATDTVLVARHDLARGHALTAADIDTVVNADANGPRASGFHPMDGWLTRRVIRAGEVLQAPSIAPPPLIARGARVTVVWETAGLRVTREGTAIAAAHRGERVVVRVDGNRRLTGIATDPGTVTVTP